MGPGSKDHLSLTTAFACTVRWSLKPGFNVLAFKHELTFGPDLGVVEKSSFMQMYMLSAAGAYCTGTNFWQYVYRARLDFNRERVKRMKGVFISGRVLISTGVRALGH